MFPTSAGTKAIFENPSVSARPFCLHAGYWPQTGRVQNSNTVIVFNLDYILLRIDHK